MPLCQFTTTRKSDGSYLHQAFCGQVRESPDPRYLLLCNGKCDLAMKRPAPVPRGTCALIGEKIGEETCATCGGNVRVKVFACPIHERCTLQKPMKGIACCVSCTDHLPVDAPRS